MHGSPAISLTVSCSGSASVTPPAVEQAGGEYRRPLAALVAYLDTLDAADPPVPRAERVLAELAPRMLALAGERALGSHPYLVSPEHTRLAREALGPDPLLGPEQTVVLEEDPDARAAWPGNGWRGICVFRTTWTTWCGSGSTVLTSRMVVATGLWTRSSRGAMSRQSARRSTRTARPVGAVAPHHGCILLTEWLRVSVLDQSPISEGSTGADALRIGSTRGSRGRTG